MAPAIPRADPEIVRCDAHVPPPGLTRCLRTLGRTGSAVLVPGAGRDILATVPPSEPLELEPDAHLAGLQVQILPPQPERLPLAQAAGKTRLPAAGVAAVGNGREHGARLPACQRHLGGVAQRGRLNKPTEVACEITAFD